MSFVLSSRASYAHTSRLTECRWTRASGPRGTSDLAATVKSPAIDRGIGRNKLVNSEHVRFRMNWMTRQTSDGSGERFDEEWHSRAVCCVHHDALLFLRCCNCPRRLLSATSRRYQRDGTERRRH